MRTLEHEVSAAFERELVVLRSRVALRLAICVGPPLVGFALVLGTGLHLLPRAVAAFSGPLILLGVVAAMTMALVGRDSTFIRREPARVRVDERGVHVRDRLELARDRIASGYVQPRPGASPTVKLVNARGGALLEIEVTDEAEGVALLRALDLDAAHATVAFWAASPIQANRARPVAASAAIALFWIFGNIVAQAMHHAWQFFAMIPLLALLAAALFVLPTRVVVGADGVATRWLFARRFYRFRDIEDVMPTDDGVMLFRKDAASVHIATSALKRSAQAAGRPRRDAIVARVREALDNHRATASAANAAALLERGDRSPAHWLDALRELATPRQYRAPALPPEQLWRIAEDPSAATSARVAAAIALRVAADVSGEDAARRIRIVASATASPKVRVALESAADGDGDALVEALEAASEADARAK